MVQGHHLQLRSCPPLFHNFWQLNVKVAAAHHLIIQKERDELLSMGAIEPSFGGAGFLSSVFVVPKHTGGLWPILNLKWFNHYFHISYLHIAIAVYHNHFLQFGWHNMRYQLKVLTFGMATAPRVFTALTKPILFLCHHKGFRIVIYLDDILVLVHSKQAGKMAHSYLCSLLVFL